MVVGGRDEGRDEDEHADIKSNNPHLTGGEYSAMTIMPYIRITKSFSKKFNIKSSMGFKDSHHLRTILRLLFLPLSTIQTDPMVCK